MRKLPSYIKDANDFLTKIQVLGDLPAESLLVTLDVTFLYINIPHQEGLNACREILDTRTILDPPTDDLIHLAFLILEKNNFSFNNHVYLQIQGTAVGTRIAPSYTNIFMDKFETELLWSVSERPMVWWRYIDHVFANWPHGEENLEVFLNKLNLFHPTIKFTAEWSQEFVTFLNTRIIREGNHFITDLYTKPTDTHQYLHRHSCHPPSLQSEYRLQSSPYLEYPGSTVKRTITCMNDEWASYKHTWLCRAIMKEK